MQLLNAQSDITTQLNALRQQGGTSDLLSLAEGQQAALTTVQQRLASGMVSVTSLRAEVSAAVAQATAVGQQIRTAGESMNQAGSPLDRARAEARVAVDDFTDTYFRKRIFDPYLQFASAEEEAAYRHRETERHQAIEAAQAEGTAEGDLRATTLAREQLKDAGAHGAAASPDYQPMMDGLDRAHASLEAQVRPASRTYDPLDEIAPAVAADPSILAALRDAGVTAADPNQHGHGVSLTNRDGVAATRS